MSSIQYVPGTNKEDFCVDCFEKSYIWIYTPLSPIRVIN